MLCALTVRKLRPGAIEDFKRAFAPPEGTEPPPGWKRFYALRSVQDENEFVASVGTDGVFEVVDERGMDR